MLSKDKIKKKLSYQYIFIVNYGMKQRDVIPTL